MCATRNGHAPPLQYYGVVNAPHLALASSEAFQPFVALGQALGALQGQVLFSPGAQPTLPRGTRVRIELEGAPLGAPGGAALMRAAVLKGLLPVLPFAEVEAGEVNLVNAGGLAEAAGLDAVAVHTSSGGSAAVGSSNLVRVTVTPPCGTGDRVALGSIIDGVPRVVQMDFWKNFPAFEPSGHIRALPAGCAPPFARCPPRLTPHTPRAIHPRPFPSSVFYNNIDIPGQISKVTTVLSDYQVNIASLNVARQHVGSPALSIVRCDSRIPAKAVEEIKVLEGITRVSTASF